MPKVELPFETITEILTRLPVKSLNRLKCVSKSWNSLISSRSFITLHSNSTPNLLRIVLTSHHYTFLNSALIPDTDIDKLHFTQLNHPVKPIDTQPEPDIYLIDSCNGVLLVSDCDKENMFLYNPANNTFRLLPPIKIRKDELLGLGYDSHTDEYKVIRAFQTSMWVEMSVYSMRGNVWKVIKDESVLVRTYCIQPANAVGANGIMHFVAVTTDFKFKPVLLGFDVRTEAFSIVDYPELECYDLSKLSMSLRELRGCLCMLVSYHSKCVKAGGQLLYSDVWEMREGSWVKLFRMRKYEVVGKGERCMSFRLVAYLKDEGKVLVSVDFAWFCWYDLVTKRVMKVKTPGLPDEDYPRIAVTYVESLLSVSNDKAVSKGEPTSKKTVQNKNMGDFLSKGFKLRL